MNKQMDNYVIDAKEACIASLNYHLSTK